MGEKRTAGAAKGRALITGRDRTGEGKGGEGRGWKGRRREGTGGKKAHIGDCTRKILPQNH